MSTGYLTAALRAHLLSDAQIVAITGQRVFVGQAVQGNIGPHIIINTINEDQDYHLEGESGPAQARVQIDCWGLEVADVAQLGRLTRLRMSGYSGRVYYGSMSPQAFVTIKGIFLQNGREAYEPESKLYRNMRDYLVHYDFA